MFTMTRAATSGKTNLIHKSLVALLGLRLDAQQHIAHILYHVRPNLLIEERSGQHLEDQSGTAVLVGQDAFQHLVIGREEQCLQDSIAGLWFVALVIFNTVRYATLCVQR